MLPAITDRSGPTYHVQGTRVLGLCSNDYLGLGTSALRILSAGFDASSSKSPNAVRTGADRSEPRTPDSRTPTIDTIAPAIPRGATASRLVAGDLECHRQAEAALARLLDTEDCVLFPSGYQANVAALSAVIEREELVHCDELMHASLIDGVRLARATPNILAHLHAPPRIDTPRIDTPHIDRSDHASATPQTTALSPTRTPMRQSDAGATAHPVAPWWICESIYSMDGDQTDPADARAHLASGGLLYVDEAHSIGMYAGGQGWSAEHKLRPTMLCAPLGKAFGLAGAAVGCTATVGEWLRTRARGFVFSTGIAPILASQVLEVLGDLCGPLGEQRRESLWSNVRVLAHELGIPPDQQRSPIFPILIDPLTPPAELRELQQHHDATQALTNQSSAYKDNATPDHATQALAQQAPAMHASLQRAAAADSLAAARNNERALALSRALLARGYHVQAIRPPTVPPGTARLRVTVTALHTHDQLRAFARELKVLRATI